MLYVTVLSICAVLALYIGEIDHFVFSEGAAVVPLMYFLGDVITEVYGYKIARRVTWYALVSVLFFMSMIMVLVHVPTPPFWHLQHQYQFMYDRFTRVILCFALFIPASEFINSYIISKLKIFCRGRWLWLRSLTSSLTGRIGHCHIRQHGFICRQSIYSASISNYFCLFCHKIIVFRNCNCSVRCFMQRT